MSQKQRLFCSFFCDMNYDEQYRDKAKQQMKGKWMYQKVYLFSNKL